MLQTFTQNDLIRYLYQETSEEENRLLERQLDIDDELLLRYQELSRTLNLLTESELCLPDRVTGRILRNIALTTHPTN